PGVSALVANEIERGNAVVIAGDSFTIDDAGARAQAGQRLDNEREAVGEVIARTAVEPHSRAVFAGNNPKPSCLISCSHWLPEGSLWWGNCTSTRQGSGPPLSLRRDGKLDTARRFLSSARTRRSRLCVCSRWRLPQALRVRSRCIVLCRLRSR